MLRQCLQPHCQTRSVTLPSIRYCTTTHVVYTRCPQRNRACTCHGARVYCQAAVHVRPAQPKDAEAASQLDAATAGLSAGWSEQTFADAINSSLSTVLVAESEEHPEELVGFACMRVVAGEAQLENMAVLPQAQGQGVGSALLSQLLQVCGCLDISKNIPCYLEVRANNTAAIKLYRTMGFQDSGLRRRFYADNTDALLMTRPPGPS